MNLFNQNYYIQIHMHKLQLEKKKKKKPPKGARIIIRKDCW